MSNESIDAKKAREELESKKQKAKSRKKRNILVGLGAIAIGVNKILTKLNGNNKA